MTFDEAERVTDRFIESAKVQCLRDYEAGLYRIARLHWWELWTARRIAQQTLGIGPYWDSEFRKGRRHGQDARR